MCPAAIGVSASTTDTNWNDEASGPTIDLIVSSKYMFAPTSHLNPVISNPPCVFHEFRNPSNVVRFHDLASSASLSIPPSATNDLSASFFQLDAYIDCAPEPT